jgi:pimeloyl-ACP methyl ester carboxylesterase
MNDVREIAARFAPKLDPSITECWMEFDGAKMRYLRAGAGRPLILLHGLMGYSFSWRYTMPALAPYHTLYAPDMFGAGFSDRPRQIDHSVRGTALRILQFVKNLGLTSFDLLGTSRGGIVATAVAAECLEDSPKIRKLVLVCPVNPYSSHGKRLAPFFGTGVGATAFRFAIERRPSLYPYFHSRLFGDRKKIPAGSLDGYRAPLAIPGLFEHALSIVRTWTADLHEQEMLLPKLKNIPTLLVWGDKDPAVYITSIKELARHFDNVKTVVFPGIGHLPYEECPKEFNRELMQFLQ